MVKKAITAIDNIKLWLFIPMVTIILWFGNKFYDQQDDIGKDVITIKIELQGHAIKVESLERRITDQEFMTKQFYKWQLEKHATEIDTTTNE